METERAGGFREALARNEVVPFLRGDGSYRIIPQSDFAGEDAPTDTWQVLREIYIVAEETAEGGKALAKGIAALLEGSARDVYLAVLYLTRLSLAEKGGRLPLKLPLHELLLAAQEKIGKLRRELSEELVFPNGFVKKAALADMQGWNETVFLPFYGVDLLLSIRPK